MPLCRYPYKLNECPGAARAVADLTGDFKGWIGFRIDAKYLPGSRSRRLKAEKNLG
jgi:hypothetical protein